MILGRSYNANLGGLFPNTRRLQNTPFNEFIPSRPVNGIRINLVGDGQLVCLSVAIFPAGHLCDGNFSYEALSRALPPCGIATCAGVW